LFKDLKNIKWGIPMFCRDLLKERDLNPWFDVIPSFSELFADKFSEEWSKWYWIWWAAVQSNTLQKGRLDFLLDGFQKNINTKENLKTQGCWTQVAQNLKSKNMLLLNKGLNGTWNSSQAVFKVQGTDFNYEKRFLSG